MGVTHSEYEPLFAERRAAGGETASVQELTWSAATLLGGAIELTAIRRAALRDTAAGQADVAVDGLLDWGLAYRSERSVFANSSPVDRIGLPASLAVA
jgi:hypothetical protein